MTATVVLDGGWSTTSQAEHALHESAARLGFRPRTACTEFRTDPARVVVLVELDDPPPAGLITESVTESGGPAPVAGSVAGTGSAVTTGRAFVFAGSPTLTGVLRVHDLLYRSAIDDVLLIGGTQVGPGVEVDTQDFVRPVFRDGRLVLLTRPGAGARVVPFEQPHPTPCCADHA